MISLATLLAGLLLLVGGAEVTVRGARSLGFRLGLSPMVVGLTIVAYGTSTPELVVSTAAALDGHDGIAVGNVIGSNVSNTLLILGLCAVVRPLETHARVLRVEAPLLVGASALAAALLALGQLGRLSGFLLVAGLVVYTVLTVRLERAESSDVQSQMAEALPGASNTSLGFDLGLTALGLVLLIAGGVLLVRGAVDGAAAVGVPPAVVGLTVVAVGTSLPELSASLLAAIRGHGDIAVGNVLGSNLFNLLGVLGIAALADPIAPGGIGWRDIGTMLASSIVLWVFLRTRRRLERWEGAILLAGYSAYVLSTMR